MERRDSERRKRRAAREEFYARAFRFAVRRARFFGLDEAEAEDVGIDAVIKLLLASPSLADAERAASGSWMTTVVLNLVRDRARRARRRRDAVPTLTSLEALRPRPPRPDQLAARVDSRNARESLWKRVRVAHEEEADIVALVHAGELPRLDAARRLGLSIGAFDKLAQRTKAALRAAAASEHLDAATYFDDAGPDDEP